MPDNKQANDNQIELINQSRKNKLPYKLSFILQNCNIAYVVFLHHKIPSKRHHLYPLKETININFLRVDMVFI